ncbi:tape measure protein [Colwellia psychrerythraea]|uniref:Phage tape measure protein n=1 Tax=Colwellia psychrerythraea TaxID=28229 RepID=A0A099KPL9_COLPS|nr:tape measure protein [Colwellia psychrerythraea]KGJ92120.1 phage tape measure protein [Colwellia psychrerythraea]
MNDLKLGIVFDVKNGKFKSEVKQNTQVVEKLGHSTQRTAGQTRQLGSALDNTNNKLIATNRVAQSVTRAIGGLAAGFGALQLGSGLVRELATFQDIRTRLQGLSTDAADYAAKERWLIDLAAEHHKELNGLADGYSRLSTLTQEKIITDGQARDMLEGLSNAAAQNGATNADLERVYYGLAQALGQGVVQMQEVNQVVEPLPGLMTKLARAAGEETGAGFKALIASGEVTSEMFGGLLVKALTEYDGAAAKTADNINTKYRDIKREYQLLAVELEQPINGALLPTLDGLASGLAFLKEHAEGVITILEVGLVVAAGHAVKAISNKTAVTYASITADTAKAHASATAAKAEEVLAVSANHRAVQEQAAAKRSLANATNTYARTRAVKNLAIANGKVAASEKALVAVRTTLTAANNRLYSSGKSLALMSSLVGGLPGLLTIAGFAMYSFATSTSDAADQAKRLNEENKKLNPFANYTFKTATGALQRYQGQLELAQQMAEETQTRFKNPFFKNVTASDVTAANKEVERLTETIEALQAIVGEKAPGKKETPKQDVKTLDIFSQQREALTKQLALLGKTSELSKAEYATTLGKYKDLLPAQKEVIVNLAKEIDAKNKSLAVDVVNNTQAKQLASNAQNYAESLQRKVSLTGEVTNVQQLAYELENGSLIGINDQLKEQLMLKAELADRVEADAEKQLPFWEQMNEHIASTTENFDVMWGNSFDRFAQGIGDATATSILEGQSFSDAMKNIGRSVIKEVISGIVQIGVKKLALFAIEKAINKGTAISAATFMSANASATAMQAGLATFASISAIPVLGPAAAPGAMTAALAVATPMAGAITAASAGMAGMAHDGIDEIPREGTWLLDKGERVVDSRTNQDLKQALNKGSVGSSSGTVIHLTNHIKIEGDNNTSESLESAIELSTEKMRADLYEDFSTGGLLTQQLKAAM